MKCCKIVTGGEGGFLYRVEKIKWLKGEGLGRILLFGVPIRISGGAGRNRLAKGSFAGLKLSIMPRRWYHDSYYLVKDKLKVASGAKALISNPTYGGTKAPPFRRTIYELGL
jgi:hypothetical protein